VRGYYRILFGAAGGLPPAALFHTVNRPILISETGKGCSLRFLQERGLEYAELRFRLFKESLAEPVSAGYFERRPVQGPLLQLLRELPDIAQL